MCETCQHLTINEAQHLICDLHGDRGEHHPEYCSCDDYQMDKWHKSRGTYNNLPFKPSVLSKARGQLPQTDLWGNERSGIR
jgi:hypothetical protein